MYRFYCNSEQRIQQKLNQTLFKDTCVDSSCFFFAKICMYKLLSEISKHKVGAAVKALFYRAIYADPI